MLNSLPTELLLRIFTHITPYECCHTIGMVCKKWHILCIDEQLWQLFYDRFIGGALHYHIPTCHNIYLDSYKWVIECLIERNRTQQILFASTFGHSALFGSLLVKHAIDPITFGETEYIKGSRYHRNVLQVAIQQGFDDIVFVALQASIMNPQSLLPLLLTNDSLGYNSLHLASIKGRNKVVRAILDEFDSKEVTDSLTIQAVRKTERSRNLPFGISALHLAAENGHQVIVSLLIKKNANVNILDQSGETPLHYAARSGHLSCVVLLLENKADPCIRSIHQFLAEHIADQSGYAAIAEYIQSCHNGVERTFHKPPKMESAWHFGGAMELLARRYLMWMVELHRELILPGIEGASDALPPSIDLESVYLSLKVDRAGSYERLQAFQKLEQQVVELEAQSEQGFQPEERHAAVVSQLIESPAMASFAHTNEIEDNVSLGQAFQSERGLVVLGDPGGGKTTLARWIALQLARTLLNRENRVRVVASQVHTRNANTRRADTLVDIGISRLPVLVRVADFAQYLEVNRDKKKTSLFDFLGHHPWQGAFPSFGGVELDRWDVHDLIVDSIKRGRCVVIVDGLDEVANPVQRQEVVDEVDKFTWQWIYRQDGSDFDSLESWKRLQTIEKATEELGNPVDTGGNQLVITSRIAGYHSAPMKSPLTHVTIQPMQETSIKNFCTSWMIAVHKIENKGQKDPAIVTEFALLESTKLNAAICEQPGVRRLAENPLLLTILALVFRKQKMSLPKKRAQLYHVAMSILVDVWRDCGLSLNETIRTLAPVAAHLHQHRAMGLISKEELHVRVFDARRDCYGEGEVPSDKSIKKEVAKFIEVVGNQVGFLVARGESMFGFLHQSFQEYLAGWHIVGGEQAAYGIEKAAENFIAHIGDVRWREPLLLALGMLTERWCLDDREKFLNLILDTDNNAYGTLIPRASLLVISGLHEMSSIPNKAGRKLEVLLLLSYANQNKFDKNSFELLRYRIEKAFEDLLKIDAEQVKEFFAYGLKNVEDTIKIVHRSEIGEKLLHDFACACGEIIYKLSIFSKEICDALQGVIHGDSSKWGWVIHRCLRRFASAKSINDSGVPEGPWVQFPFHSNLNGQARFPDRFQKYLIASLAGGFQDFDVVASTKEYFGYVNLLLMVSEARQAIYEQNRSFERWGDQNEASFNIAVYLDTFSPKKFWDREPSFSRLCFHRWSPLLTILSEYTCNLSSIQIPSSGEPFSSNHVEPFNAEKVKEILLYIVRKLAPPVLGKQKFSTNFSSRLRSILGKEEPILEPKIIQSLQEQDIKEIKTEALIGLIGMGADVKKLMQEDSVALHCDLERIDSIVHSFRDPAARSRYHIFNSLCELSRCYGENPHQFRHILMASISTATRAIDLLDITSILGVRPPTDANPERISLLKHVSGENETLVFGFYLLDRLVSLNNDDREYYATFCAHTVLFQPGNEFAHVIAIAPLLYHQVAQNIPFADPWPVGHTSCAAIWDKNLEALPMETLTALETVPLDWWKERALTSLYSTISLLDVNLIVEVLTVYLFCVDSETGADPFGGIIQAYQGVQISPSFFDLPPQKAITLLAYSIKDPYLRARALWRICRYIPQDEEYYALTQDALGAAREISGNLLGKTVVLEKIVETLPKPQGLRVFSELCDIAMIIPDRDNRSRALARLSLSPLAKHEQSSDLLRKAIRTTASVTDIYKRATLLHEIHSIVLQHKGKKENMMWQKAVEKLNNTWCIAYAEGNFGRILFECAEHLHEKGNHEPWMALTLYAMFEDAKAVADLPMNWNSRLWSAILEEQWHTRAYESLRNQAVAEGSYGLVIDQNAAQAIGSLIEKARALSLLDAVADAQELYDHIYNLLSLVSEASADALLYVPAWKQYLEPLQENKNFIEYERKIIQQIALLDAEQAILTAESVIHILEILQFGDDRSRLRAQVALHGESFNTSNAFRRLRASVIGLDVLLILAEASWEGMQSRRFMLSQTIRWMGHDMVHDDPAVIEALIDLFDKAKTEQELYVSSLWLGNCECIAPSAWGTWLTFLPKGAASHRVQLLLLIAVCKTAHSASHCVGNWPPRAYEELLACGLDPEVTKGLTCCEEWPKSIANAAQKALRNYTDQAGHCVQLANEAFAFERAQFSLYDSLGSVTDLEVFGKSFFHHYNSNNRVESCVPRAIMQLINTPQILSVIILPWLQECLEPSRGELEFDMFGYRKADSLLQVAAGLAKRLPVTFQNCSSPELASLLYQAAAESVSAFGRIAAMELISIYGHVTESTVQAIKCALLDVGFVAESALACTKQFRYLEDGLLEFLISELYHEFPSMCLAAAKILSAVYLAPCTNPKQRTMILEALAEALRHPSIKNKPVFTMINTATKITTNHASETMICCIGDLDQALFHELSFVCGFSE